MWELKKPRKIKAKILLLSIIPIASLAFVSSCSFIKKIEKKPVIKEENRIQTKIKTFQFSFWINSNQKSFGVIKNVEQAQELFNQIRDDSHEKRKSWKDEFIKFFKSKYNEDFFKNNDLIFWYTISGTSPYKTIVDNVTLKDKTLTVNGIYLSRLRNEFHDIRIARTSFENWIHLITISKANEYNKVEINKINTLKKFKDYTSKDYRDNYDEKNSKIENKEFNTYE